ncbi:hypothetical protein EYV94_01520 [Puteibacter caeruleilacunae]|nr:hypothetical protein EYV94_01520 [Puteibacter caeruleilacunae]
MKRTVFTIAILLLTIASYAQLVSIKPDKERNYSGYRPKEIRDHLLLDLGNGERMDMKYTWSRIRPKYIPEYTEEFDHMLQAAINAIKTIELNDDFKYHIRLKRKWVKINRSEISMDSVKYIRSHPNEFSEDIITIKERKNTNTDAEFVMKNNKLTKKVQWQHAIELESRMEDVTKFYINDLENLENLKIDYEKVFTKCIEIIQDRHYYHFCSRMNFKMNDGEPTFINNTGWRKRPPYYLIGFYPMIGTSLVKGKLSTDMGLLVAGSFNEKQNGNARIGLRYQLKCFGEDTPMGRRSRYNGFVDAIMDINGGQDMKPQEWIGLGVGHLAHRSGDIYGAGTWRVFMKYRSSKYWGIQPEYIYSFKDKKGSFGIGVYLSF